MRLSLALRAGFGVLALAALLAVPGCGSRVIDLREPPDPDPVPEATSASNAVRRLQWAWNHRDPAPYRDLFTADFRFQSASFDSAGSLILYRDQEQAFAGRLFRMGGAGHPAATSISCWLTLPLIETPSSLQGHHPTWHREISVNFTAGVRVPGGDYRMIDRPRFLLVRGDSARVPQELIDQGHRPDSTRWWIERWESEFDQPDSMRGIWSVSELKAQYLGIATLASARRN